MIDPRLLASIDSALDRFDISPGVTLNGVCYEFLPFLARYLAERFSLPILLGLQKDGSAPPIRDALLALGADSATISFYPGGEDPWASPAGFASPFQGFRYHALAGLAADELPRYFLAANDVLESGLPAPSALRGALLKVLPGSITYAGLCDWLNANLYERVSLVAEPGTYALRGSVIDIYPVNKSYPVRFDFFGETLEELREFDVHSQMGAAKLSFVEILSLAGDELGLVPVSEYFSRGYLVLQQIEDNRWRLADNLGALPGTVVSLGVDGFTDAKLSVEQMRERWKQFRDTDMVSSLATLVSSNETARNMAAAKFPEGAFELFDGDLPAGFASTQLGLFVISPNDFLYELYVQRPVLSRGAPSLASVRQHLEVISDGDPLVHIHHGVGRYRGLTQLSVSGAQRECLVLEYGGGDKIYVSTDKIASVLPYTTTEGANVRIDALGSGKWSRIRNQARRSAEEIVDHLAELYAQRASAVGPPRSPDDDLQLAFLRSFPFEDTRDQIRATEEILADMDRPQPMDRLLCGDVGFGKTEVAMRAAFKAVRGGGQVAVLAPTTILADQHLISFRSRLEPFAVITQLLSRFVSKSSQRQTLTDLAEGRADIIIGTHRLLSKDVHFKNLALLIVDEEHQFGVKHKEKMKELQVGVDVLSLSATPLPRTLHLSLAGIRDLSHLDSPPRERIPIITSVHYYDDALVKSAVGHELARGGQVYFVHNEIKSIHRVLRDLGELLPDVSMAVAHGQMPGHELEQAMLAFSEGKIQMLVCTSIIESGIDLPNVNTVIINGAHRLGLSQIYQIRGRVGRSSRQAYAYLLVRRRPPLTKEATKRLKTIERYAALGSGYAVALKDLEIRGTGNIFGHDQSGHVAAVGFDLYNKIVGGIIRERGLDGRAPGRQLLDPDDITISICPSAGIPADYVPDADVRLNLYRRISALEDDTDFESLTHELADRFGSPPSQVIDLVDSIRLRGICARLGISSVRFGQDRAILFCFSECVDPGSLLRQIQPVLQARGTDYRFIKKAHNEFCLSFTPSNKVTPLIDAIKLASVFIDNN